MRKIALLACAILAGCTVDYPPVIDDGFFACTTAEDCGEGQGCAEGNVYSADFCRPACDPNDPSSCDGVCTANGACLGACTIATDGTGIGCSGDFVCVRTDALRDEGICYPAIGCSRTADCTTALGEQWQCLNDALGLPAPTAAQDLRFDNMYCTGAPDAEGRCPQGYLVYRYANVEGEEIVLCYAPCELDADGPFCPPATTCFRGFGELAGTPNTPPCLPGIWGLPCADDTQCLIGRCLPIDASGQRACTETCADAERYGGCTGLEELSEAFGTLTRMSCENVAGQDVCVPRFDMLSLCHQLDCVADVPCTDVLFSDGVRAHVCIRSCVTAEDCAVGTGGVAADYRCLDAGDANVCMRKRPLGARCDADLDCREGRCCELSSFRACLRECPAVD
jgi:hypothetical protein